jgi:ketosteroid isomerase-like protein
MRHHMKTICFSISLLIAAALANSAESPTPSHESGQLIETIAQMDTAAFVAFNAHNVDRLMSFFTDDLEFYHDTGGLTGYQQTTDNFKKLFTDVPDIHRDLVPGSLEVYPLKDYGAIEVGVHRFTHIENGKKETGSFKFLHVWRKAGDSWKIARVISYGH